MLRNPGFSDANDPFVGWDKAVHANPDSYEFVALQGMDCLSGRCILIRQAGHEPWGGVFQYVPFATSLPVKARFSAALKGIDADSATHLVALVKRAGGHDAIHQLPVDLTPVWAPATLEFEIAPGSRGVEVQVVHHGAGAVAVDQVKLELVAP